MSYNHWSYHPGHYASQQHLAGGGATPGGHCPASSPLRHAPFSSSNYFCSNGNGLSKHDSLRYTSLHPLMLTRQPSSLLLAGSSNAGLLAHGGNGAQDYLEPFPHAMTEWRDR